LAATAAGVVLAAGAPAAAAPVGTQSQNQTSRVSLDAAHGDIDDDAGEADISSDGGYVAYVSSATDIVPGHGVRDGVYLVDRLGAVQVISVDEHGVSRPGIEPRVSVGGRYVVFSSESPLLDMDTNQTWDVYRRDTLLGVTELVSVDHRGGRSSGLSWSAEMSDDGRWVSFVSTGDDIVEGVVTPGLNKTGFVRDMASGTTAFVTAHVDGSPIVNVDTMELSADGRHVLFIGFDVAGAAHGPKGEYVRDLDTGEARFVSVGSDGRPLAGRVFLGDLDADGSIVTYRCDCPTFPGFPDYTITLHDLATDHVEVVDVAPDGGPSGGGNRGLETLSNDGRFVTFVSTARNLVPRPHPRGLQVFWRDRAAGVTRVVAVGHRGERADGVSASPSITADGTEVAFESEATNLVIAPPDENLSVDVFVRKLAPPVGLRQ
jgi:Tol biopolymer transport system component